jgi:hypothetical protein
MLKDALSKNGYNLEERYFHDETRRQIEALRKDPLKIRRMLRALANQASEVPGKAGASSAQASPQKKVA